jgi:ring-1,2-phenylacetyl-CoA epoxidase subunit PaaD
MVTSVIDILSEVADPELPFLNIVELGIVRDAQFDGDQLRVTITPTYFGCPALYAIEQNIRAVLQARGFKNVSVHTSFSPAWTTDWLSAETKQKLKAAGIAPPQHAGPVQCPYCDSADTEVRSEFGSTPCKSLHFCHNCRQPFEQFKCI